MSSPAEVVTDTPRRCRHFIGGAPGVAGIGVALPAVGSLRQATAPLIVASEAVSRNCRRVFTVASAA